MEPIAERQDKDGRERWEIGGTPQDRHDLSKRSDSAPEVLKASVAK